MVERKVVRVVVPVAGERVVVREVGTVAEVREVERVLEEGEKVVPEGRVADWGVGWEVEVKVVARAVVGMVAGLEVGTVG